LRYREYAPPPRLEHVVRCFWSLERDYAGGDGEMLWPDGRTELIFHYGARYEGADAAFVIGPLRERLPLRASGRLRLIGARFEPWGLYAAARLPLHELVDRIVAADVLFGLETRELTERLADADEAEAIAILTTALASRVSGVDPRLPSLCRALDDTRLNLGALAREHNLSPRQLERRFRETTGVSPRRFHVVRRFDRLRLALHRRPFAGLEELAFHHGYYDYAHLSKDFARFLGCTPFELQRRLQAQAIGPPRDVVFLQDEPRGATDVVRKEKRR
jgi:AraC-like DNA-binding protein